MSSRWPWPLSELLTTYSFWLMDVGPLDGVGLPLFAPLFGFSTMTAPSVTLGVRTIKEANWYYPRKVLDGSATVSPIRMTRGISFVDADFYRWIQTGLFGDTGHGAKYGTLIGGGPTPRRNFLLIHYFSTSIADDDWKSGAKSINADIARGDSDNSGAWGDGVSTINQVYSGIAGAAGLAVAAGGAIFSNSGGNWLGTTAAVAAQGAGFAAINAAVGYALRIPAKAYYLKGCLPTMYKPASDFDASASNISIQELEFEMEEWEEISLAA